MFGGLIVLNQRRSDDGREPGPEQNFTRSLCKGAPKHFYYPNLMGLFFSKKE